MELKRVSPEPSGHPRSRFFFPVPRRPGVKTVKCPSLLFPSLPFPSPLEVYLSMYLYICVYPGTHLLPSSFSRRLRSFGKCTRIPSIFDDSLFHYRDSKSMSSGMAVSDGFVFVSFAHKSLKINRNASKPSMNINITEHPPSKGEKC